MINVIQGRGINEVVYKAIEKIIFEGDRTPSRNGDVSSINNAFLNVSNPRNRHLNLKGRKNNIFATIAETFWVFAGDDAVDPFLSYFLPRAKDFSDDGKVWYGAYGPRLFKYNQIEDIIRQFKNEGIFSRRASFYIGTPEKDTFEQFGQVLNQENVKDRPCNMAGNFFITEDKKVHLNMMSRSGDILWGIGSINIFEFTFFQEYILQRLQEEVDPELELGEYHHLITNMHLYDFSGKQGYEVVRNKLEQRLNYNTRNKLKFPHMFRDFNLELLSLWTDMISNDSNHSKYMKLLDSLFNDYRVGTENNLLYKYCELVTAYISCKQGGEVEVSLEGYDKEFTQSIIDSNFRKFNII